MYYDSIVMPKNLRVLSAFGEILLGNGFEISSAVFAQGADDISGQVLAFVDIATDLTYPTFFAFGLRFRLNLAMVVAVGHGGHIGDHAGFGY